MRKEENVYEADCGMHGNEQQAGADERLGDVLRELAHKMHMQSDGKGSQGRLLQILARREPITQRELQEIAGIRSGSLSEVMGKLESAGSILREVSKSDRRGVTVKLTDEGRAQAAAYAVTREQRRSEMFASLSEEEKLQLLDMLSRLNLDWETRFFDAKQDEGEHSHRPHGRDHRHGHEDRRDDHEDHRGRHDRREGREEDRCPEE